MNIQAANQINQYQLNTRLGDANKQFATAQTTPVEQATKTDMIQISHKKSLHLVKSVRL
ncbi:hypothetical protein [Pseudoalteromonas prydzensis]|uniref:hypothetical protein n=1 Tax=Pseudoalteromonas prydzensis TaxID=182141 RepID=UPI003704419E